MTFTGPVPLSPHTPLRLASAVNKVDELTAFYAVPILAAASDGHSCV